MMAFLLTLLGYRGACRGSGDSPRDSCWRTGSGGHYHHSGGAAAGAAIIGGLVGLA